MAFDKARIDNLLTTWMPTNETGTMQGSRTAGMQTRPSNPTLRPDEPALYRIDCSFGKPGSPAVSGTSSYSSTNSRLGKPIEGVSQVFLSQLQWLSVSGVTSGDGYCRFRLQLNGTDLFTDQTVTNSFTTAPVGFVVLLDNTTGTMTFNPPLPIYTYKDGQGVFGNKQYLELGITDQSGQPRTYTQVSMVLLANSKYYQ